MLRPNDGCIRVRHLGNGAQHAAPLRGGAFHLPYAYEQNKEFLMRWVECSPQ